MNGLESAIYEDVAGAADEFGEGFDPGWGEEDPEDVLLEGQLEDGDLEVSDFEDGDFEVSDEEGGGEGDFEELLEADISAGYSPEDIAVMEALAEAAADADSEEQEDAFIGALASIAAGLAPHARKLLPVLARIGKRLFKHRHRRRHGRRSHAGRTIARTVPTILRRTVASQQRRHANGQPVTVRSTLRSAAGHTAKVLRSPRHRRMALSLNRHFARRHRQMIYRPSPRSGVGHRRSRRRARAI
jgi:hypothetical protein